MKWFYLLTFGKHQVRKDYLQGFKPTWESDAVFSLTLARSPMASRSYRRASDFLNYSPGLASDILAERKSEKKEEKNFFKKNCFPKQP